MSTEHATDYWQLILSQALCQVLGPGHRNIRAGPVCLCEGYRQGAPGHLEAGKAP